MKKISFLIIFTIILVVSSNLRAQTGGVETSYDTIPLHQVDGSVVHLIGYGNERIGYSETIDGYTVALNLHGLYVYVTQGADGSLKRSQFRANDPDKRTRKEKRFLKKVPKHIRCLNPALDEVLKGKRFL